MSQLSIGSLTASGRQDWRRPQRYGGPPVVVRRNVEIVEISLVTWPAYNSAGVVSINARTAASDESQRIIRETQAFLADTRTFLARNRKRR